MNTFATHDKELGLHQIELTLSHIRIAAPTAMKKLVTSIDAHGQLSRVIVVPAATKPNRYILMDGYLRIHAMQKLRHDIVQAVVWECSEADALISLLVHQGQRTWEAFEEAQALRELQTRYQLSQEQIATKIGRTKSWVSRRLTLLNTLPDELIHDVSEGTISVWAASRILAPLARANTTHSDYLIKYLRQDKVGHSTRELSEFFQHYQKSNKTTREKMVMEPDLFFKVQRVRKLEKEAKKLKSGPEGQWQFRLSNIKDQIKYLEKLLPQLFYERQDDKTFQELLLPLERIQDALHRILTTSRRQHHDRQVETPNHSYAASVGKELSAH